MEKNLGIYDRVGRLILGIVLLYLAFFMVENTILKALAIIIGVISLVESNIAWCGLYRLLGINTHGGKMR
ncbi:MAG TPA: DUF2892 domain-containing protein [Candidatus Nanoarchaeia archaeon]|nr:DUF2892 domain-containing protein [Candidatus Nanoarchaeia archaeon]